MSHPVNEPNPPALGRATGAGEAAFDTATGPPTTAPAAPVTVPTFGPPAAPGEIGTLGAYRATRLLGTGGMGAVYAALDTTLNRQVALKVMRPEQAAHAHAQQRFLREARAAARVTHDNIVTVYEAGERDGISYIAMQLLDGTTLDAHMKSNPVPDLALAVRVARETADGLVAAHAAGLIHRDIKPGNIWLEAPNGRVKVLDFGLARPDDDIELTDPGSVVGTPAYMSPEQARGEQVGHRTDLFSLGAVLYRLVTGKLPFPGATTAAVLQALANRDPEPVRTLNPAAPEPLAELIHQLLAKDPAQRPQTAKEVSNRLAAVERLLPGVLLEGTSTVTSVAPSRMEKAKRAKDRQRTFLATAFAALALAVVASVVIIIRNKDGSETRIEVPAGSTVVIAPSGDKGDQTAPGLTPKPVGAPASDREAAEYALSIGAWVRVDSREGDIKTVAELPKGRFALVWADLSKTPVTDAGLAHFKGCASLREVYLNDTKITDAGLAHLAACPKLVGFGAHGTPITDAGLAPFKNHTGFTWIDLGYTGITDAGLAHLKECKQLDWIYLSQTKITDAGLAYFKECDKLAEFQAVGTAITDAGLVNFAGCKELRYFGLDGTKITDAGMIHLRGCTKLGNIGLGGTAITDAGLVHFRDCKDLTQLHLSETGVTDVGLANFKHCKGLYNVHLVKTGITDAGLAQFAGSDALQYLYIDDTAVTDAGLAHLKGCKHLTQLGVGCPNVKGPGLTALKECPELRWLRLNRSGIGDAGLAHLKNLRQLTNLDVSYMGISDTGLAHLKECKSLRSLGIWEAKVTPKALAEFHAANPRCLIDHDGGIIQPVK